MDDETTGGERFLEIRDERFTAVASLPAWQLMRLAKSQQQKDPMAMLAGTYDFLMGVVVPEEHARLEAFLEQAADVSFDELAASTAALMTSYTDRPTGRPSRSAPGPESTGPTSRVVSLSPATVPAARTSSPDGAPAA